MSKEKSSEGKKDSCPLCNSPKRQYIEREILNGMPKKMLAEDMDIDVSVVKKHMDEHFSSVDVNENAYDGNDDNGDGLIKPREFRKSYEKFDVLSENLEKLVNRLDVMFETDKLDKESTDQLVKVAREIRHTADTLSKFEGEMRNELEVTIDEYESLKSVIIRVLDKEEQKKVLNALKEDEIKIVAEK